MIQFFTAPSIAFKKETGDVDDVLDKVLRRAKDGAGLIAHGGTRLARTAAGYTVVGESFNGENGRFLTSPQCCPNTHFALSFLYKLTPKRE